MKISIALPLLIVGLLALAGCETVSKEQCVAGDWSELGKADGAQGHLTKRFEDVVKDCGRYGITPDADAYMAGWHQGVRLYCTPQNGFSLGRQGKELSPVCPAQTAALFRQSHDLGRRIWKAEDRLRDTERRISSAESRLRETRTKLDGLNCRDVERDQREACRDRRETLRQRMDDARFELQDARFELNDRRRAYDMAVSSVNAEASRVIPGYRGE
ncbi:DUF2799 domain-containing protein [Stappia sp.]|uniref:DUF2799 domain-containing protein n=1 Tax=Stappia sp. TaxID=1870903 RepID=UPI003A995357